MKDLKIISTGKWFIISFMVLVIILFTFVNLDVWGGDDFFLKNCILVYYAVMFFITKKSVLGKSSKIVMIILNSLVLAICSYFFYIEDIFYIFDYRGIIRDENDFIILLLSLIICVWPTINIILICLKNNKKTDNAKISHTRNIIISALVIFSFFIGGICLYNHSQKKEIEEMAQIEKDKQVERLFTLASMGNLDYIKSLDSLREAIVLGNKEEVEKYLKQAKEKRKEYKGPGGPTTVNLETGIMAGNEFMYYTLSKSSHSNSTFRSEITSMSNLYVAAVSNQVEIAKILLEYGAGVNDGLRHSRHWRGPITSSGSHSSHITPLQGAINKGNKEMALFLLENGAEDRGSLSAAVYKGDKELIQLLLEKGADINNGALISAIYSNNKEMIQLLLEKGADVNYEDIDGNTALDYAKRNGNKEIEELLLKYGAKEGDHRDYSITGYD